MASGHKCQSGVDVLNFHKIADCNKLFSHSQMCDLDLVWSRSLPCFSPYKFLWVRLGTLSVKLLLSLPPALVPLPGPWPPPSSIPHPLPSWGQILYRSYEAYVHPEPKLRWPRSREARDLPAGFQPSTPALPFTSPAPRKMVREAARRRPETGRLVAHLQVIRFSLSRARQNGRMAEQHSVPLVACSSDE